MMNPTSCDNFAEQLADLLEKTLDEPTRADLEAHAVACRTCGPLLGDLRKLQSDAANLPGLTPSGDLWSGIEARIATPVVALNGGATVERRNGGTRSRVWQGLAAAALVGITATITHVMTKRSMVVTQPPRTVAALPPSGDSSGFGGRAVPGRPAPDTFSSRPRQSSAAAALDRSTLPPLQRTNVLPVSNRLTAEQTYDQEIARLRIVLATRRPQMDSATVAIVDHNLLIIDTAIAQCRQALHKDPASRFLLESLDGAMNDKVRLLRTAAQLPVRT